MLTQSKQDMLDHLETARDKSRKAAPVEQVAPLLLSAVFMGFLSAAAEQWYETLQADEQAHAQPAVPLRGLFSEKQFQAWRALNNDATDAVDRFRKQCAFLNALEDARLKNVFEALGITTSASAKQKKTTDQILDTVLAALAKLDLRPAALERTSVPAEVFGELLVAFSTEIKPEGAWTAASPSIEALMVALAQPNIDTPLCLLTSRTGTLAVEIQRQIAENHQTALGGDIASFSLRAEEASPQAWALSKLYLLLAGVNDQTIKQTDSLEQPALLDKDKALQTFQTVFAMPPIARRTQTQTLVEQDPFRRFPYGATSTSQADWAYIQDAISRLEPKGTAYVLTAPATLFRSGGDQQIREAIIRADVLSAVIHLPEGSFVHTSVAPVLMIFERQRTHKGQVLFVHAADAFERERYGSRLTQEHIDHIVSVVHNWTSEPRFSQVVNLADIQAKDFNLQATRYVDTYEPVWNSTLEEVQQRLQDAEARRSELARQMDALLAEVGK